MTAVDTTEEKRAEPARFKRVDARRNEQSLLDAAAAVFVTSGVDAPVREIAAKAGVGMGTIYRHFPTRADLVVAVFRHQIDACVDAAPTLLRENRSPFAALTAWTSLFVDFLVTKHGLAAALHDDSSSFTALHRLMIERIVPACELLVAAAADAGEITHDITAYELMRGIGNLCATDNNDSRYDARRMVAALMAGLAA